MLQQVSAPFRRPLLQAFRYLLEQIGGNGLYPDHAVSPGEKWQRKLESTPRLRSGSRTPADSLPFDQEGTSTMRFASAIVFGAHIVLALSVSTRAVCVAALPRPLRLIVMGCGTDAALTSFTHSFFELAALVTE